MKAIENSAVCPKCGGGHKSRPFCIYDNGYHCFSCGHTKAADRSFSPTMHKEINGVEFPEYTNNVSEYSLEALQWLSKFNVLEEEIYKHKILSCKSDGSLLFLNKQNEEVVGYQTRRVKDRLIMTQGTKIPQLFKAHDDSVIILVEDYISAIRVGKQFNVLCLWGVKIEYTILKQYCVDYNKIIIWLDNDTTTLTNRGQEAAKKIISTTNSIFKYLNNKRSFSVCNKNVTNIVTDNDPKYYLDHEINSIVAAALRGIYE